MAMEDLIGMAIFARVVKAGSFSAAANRIGLSKSAISKHITQLEERLNAQLLHRTTRRLSLTEVGATFYEHCARIVAEAEEAELVVGRLQAEPRGTLRFSAPIAFGLRHVAPSIPAFLERYPKVQLDWELDDRTLEPVAGGFDLVIHIGEPSDSTTLRARRLAFCRYIVCASPPYLDRHGTPHTPEDLERHICLWDSHPRAPRDWCFFRPQGQQIVRVNGPVRVNNELALREMVLGEYGIALLPSYVVEEDLRCGRLSALLTEYQTAPSNIYALYPQSRHRSPKVRAFIDFLLDKLTKAPDLESDSGIPERNGNSDTINLALVK